MGIASINAGSILYRDEVNYACIYKMTINNSLEIHVWEFQSATNQLPPKEPGYEATPTHYQNTIVNTNLLLCKCRVI